MERHVRNADGYPWNSLSDSTKTGGNTGRRSTDKSPRQDGTHERAGKAYNTRSKLVEFSVGQVVYRKNYKQSNKADGYNAKLGPNRIRCVVLQRKGKALYELGNAVGKVSGYSMLKTCMSPEPLIVIRRLQKATNLELWDSTS